MAFDRKGPEEVLTVLERRFNWTLGTRIALNAALLARYEKGAFREGRKGGAAGEAGEKAKV